MSKSEVELVYYCNSFRVKFKGVDYSVVEEWDECGGLDITFRYSDGNLINDTGLLNDLSKVWDNYEKNKGK